MGRDKALLPFRGGVLAQSVAEAVKVAAGSATLVGNLPEIDKLHYPVISDLYPGEGPLGGILTALAHSTSTWNLVVACDMPELSAVFLQFLLKRAEESGADAVLPQGPAGRAEPLCAVYLRRSHDPLARAYARGDRKIAVALREINVLSLPVPEIRSFQNVNTPEDWDRYATG